MMNHRVFGVFLRNWSEHRVFPLRAKIFMFISMDVSLIILYLTTQNVWLVLGVAAVMAATCAWAFRLPESKEEAISRKQAT